MVSPPEAVTMKFVATSHIEKAISVTRGTMNNAGWLSVEK